ncbi:hypothetical protein PR048_008061 [Dryococelus australis]|uniref:Uncharacterized protein n=1 Tax=Dryococelus australis TaxID=614101 RepID=A0ABQ9HW18_9NEOP|nr:hypothetical protein PR048_008061 [Dryococelus australis]
MTEDRGGSTPPQRQPAISKNPPPEWDSACNNIKSIHEWSPNTFPSTLIRGTTLPTGAAVAERLVRSPPIKAIRVQSPAGSPDFSHVGIAEDDAVGRRAFSGISRFHDSILTSIILVGSQDHAVKSRPNLFIIIITSLPTSLPFSLGAFLLVCLLRYMQAGAVILFKG